MKDFLGLVGAKTHFSLGESIIAPEDLVKEAYLAGYDAIAVADTNNINSLTKIFSEARKCEGMRAAIGFSIVVTDDLAWRRAKRGEPKLKPPQFHKPNIWIQNDEGLKAALKLLTLANDEDHFYFQAQVNLEELCEALKSGGLLYSSGSIASVFTHTDHQLILERVTDALTQSEPLLEVIPINNAYYDQISKMAIEYGSFSHSEYSFDNIIVTRPVYHLSGEARARNTMNCILRRDKVDSMWRNEPHGEHFLPTDKDLLRELDDQSKRLACTAEYCMLDITGEKFFDRLDYEWHKQDISLPQISKDPFAELARLCVEGFKNRLDRVVLGYIPEPSKMPEYKERLKYELKVLKEMGFENYFLLVHKLTSWCKDEGIMVGPGRGSVGGSLVAFLLGITDVDPIRFGLIFERFINPERLDLPDIDLDFMASRRKDVIEYLEKEFGKDKVAQISNYNVLGSASSLRSVGTAYNLNQDDIACSKMIPKEHGQPDTLQDSAIKVPEIEGFSKLWGTVWDDSVILQGKLKTYGKHAAAVVVAGEPILNRAVLENRGGTRVINWDKRVVEDFGLVKLDVLGLQTLDLLRMCNETVMQKYGYKVEYDMIPLDDRDVLKAFAEGNTVGVFQFESPGMRRLLKQLSHNGSISFEEITAVTALYRPGPMESGMLDDYVNIKSGAEYPNYLHVNMEPALKETDSVIVYQEQVMQIARDLAGFSMAGADHLRKAMGKKDKDAMAALRDRWVDGCRETSGISESDAGDLFDQVEAFAGYGFNKSHSVEYTIISYWVMYMKVKYPAIFYAAALTVLDEQKALHISKDAELNGILIHPPSINNSSNKFEVGEGVLYAPFQSIKGCSEKGAEAIMNARNNHPFDSKEDFLGRVNKRLCNKRVQAALDEVGAFADIEPGTPGPLDKSRIRSQKILLPGIVTSNVKANRTICLTDLDKEALQEVILDYKACEACDLMEECHPKPFLGLNPKIMVITDSPNWTEAKAGEMGKGEACKALMNGIKASGLSKADVYLTSLVKAPKPSGEELSNKTILGCGAFLDREIEILNPPVIVTMGSKAVRHMLPEIKGGWEEICGQSHYIPEKERTIICGLNPLMVHFDASKQSLIDDAFAEAAHLFDKGK